MSAGSSTTSLNSIFLGEVASVQSYGAFVKIPGCSQQGLVHRSQISKVNVPDVSEVLAKGDRVWCKVVSNTDDGKIGLSMKVVDQGSGKDLDPNGVQMQLDEQRRKEWVPGEKRKTISLDAVFNTTCSKCGTRGHLSKDCFQVAGGKTYDLIPEEDKTSPAPPVVQSDLESTELKAKKERKREKKEAKKAKKEAKKKKKAAKKLKKKLKKEAKKNKKLKAKKKKKHSSSDDSSRSSDNLSSSSSSSDSESETDSETEDSHHKKKPIHLASPLRKRRSGLRMSRSRSRSPLRASSKSRRQ